MMLPFRMRLLYVVGLGVSLACSARSDASPPRTVIRGARTDSIKPAAPPGASRTRGRQAASQAVRSA